MKKLLCILLMLMLCVLPALAEGAPLAAEENPFAPYALTVPEGAVLEPGEGSHAIAAGTVRVVATVIPRVPDAEPAEAIVRMMAQFKPDAVLEDELPAAEGYVALTACSEGEFGEGVDMRIVMVLSGEGDLLILSGYDLGGDEEAVQTLLDALLASLTADGLPVLMNE